MKGVTYQNIWRELNMGNRLTENVNPPPVVAEPATQGFPEVAEEPLFLVPALVMLATARYQVSRSTRRDDEDMEPHL